MATIRTTPVWTLRREAVGLILRGRTAHIAGPIASIVGTVLSLVNQGEIIFTGQATTLTWIRIMINYLVPFTVGSFGYLSACRRRNRQDRR
jgi:hypothetical protein